MPRVEYPCDPECETVKAMLDCWSKRRAFHDACREQWEREHRFACERCLRYSVEHPEAL